MSWAGTWWGVAGGLATLAVTSGVAERRRRARADLDRVGWVDWTGVQLLALIALLVAVSLALHA